MTDRPATPILRVQHLRVSYPIRSSVMLRRVGENVAVSDVTFDVGPGETVGLVGESGSGKSTIARAVIGLVKPTAGVIEFDGRDITGHSPKELKAVRRQMQMVFQDPYASLNPRLTVRDQIAECWRVHHGQLPRAQWTERAKHLMERVGLNPDYSDRYPHQFSGGQRQRIGIARALALRPKLIICDEAVSALDVSVQAQVLNLLSDLQDEFGLSYLFISHDLSVIEHLSDRVLVLNKGEVVEQGPVREIFANPRDEYTRALLAAIPVVRPWLETPA
ncbi:MAG TPA: ATP-binding cassette domain-containing protein [Nakamurella sp.]|jgi:ABC-type glutathione transport system ATPase component|nr:ATP-binding cassette domain-containing protein [Nakamurella sp.]